MIKVMIADDHVLFRKGLKLILEESEDVMVTGEAGTVKEALEQGLDGDFDVVLLDITIPGGSGLDVLRELHRERPELPVIILTQHAEEQFAVRALKEGAAGYVMKIKAPEDLMMAIRKVLSGKMYVGSSVLKAVASNIPSNRPKLLHENLSRREVQVMLLLAVGTTMTQISKQLNLSISSVNSYRTRIIEKLGLKTTAEIIHYAVKNGLV